MSKRREKNKPQKAPSRQLEQPIVKEEKKNENLVELGKYFYNLSGLVFGGVILTILLDFREDKVPLLFAGLFAMVLTAIAGWVLIKRGNN